MNAKHPSYIRWAESVKPYPCGETNPLIIKHDGNFGDKVIIYEKISVELMNIENFLPPLAGSFAGVVLGFGANYWHLHRETINRERQMLKTLQGDMRSNLENAQFNKKLLNQDIEAQKNRIPNVTSLIMLNNEVFRLIETNYPYHLLELNIFRDFGRISTNILYVNGLIQSRENYRIYNDTSNCFQGKMLNYDFVLLKYIDLIITNMNNMNVLLDIFKRIEIVKADEYSAYYEIKERF